MEDIYLIGNKSVDNAT